MKTYHFTSNKFKGHIEFTYDANGLLQRYDTTQAELNQEQATWLVSNLPKSYEVMKKLVATNPDMKLSPPMKTNVTFDEFWPKVYVNKGSSKKKSLQKWERLNQKNRDAAYNYWDTYLDQKQPGEGIKYVETYLNSEIWNN